MTKVYNVDFGADVDDFVRLLVRDAAGVPTAGLTVPYVIRDATGASVSSGALVDLAGAVGWYEPASFVLASGTFTIEYSIPAPNTGESDASIEVPSQAPRRFSVQDEAFINGVYRYNFLFTDKNNLPVAVTTPTIEIYHFDATTGDRTVLVGPAEPLVATTPAEVGRFEFLYTVPSTFVEGDILYAEVNATDPTPNGLGVIRYDYILSLRAVREGTVGSTFVNS